jgi:hypothetical protein
MCDDGRLLVAFTNVKIEHDCIVQLTHASFLVVSTAEEATAARSRLMLPGGLGILPLLGIWIP